MKLTLTSRFAVALMLLAVLLFALDANAVIIPLSASMDCAQAGTCGAGGSGTGSAAITLDDVSNLLSWNVSWSGLSAPDFLAHFHGPALPGQPAGVQVGIGIPSPQIGSTTISAQQKADLLAGLWYVNIHSTTFQGGEIRGQVVPEPATAVMLGSGMAALFAAWRRKRRLSP